MKSTITPVPTADVTTASKARGRGPMRSGVVNMKDVAERAGVSTSTVSRVIAQNPAVHEQTKERVLAAMADLNYVVNGLAQSMQGRGSRAVGFLVSHMVGPTFADVAQGVEEEVAKLGDLLTIITTHADPSGEMKALQQMREQRARAVLLVGASPTGQDYEERLRKYQEFLSATDTQLILCGHQHVSSVPGLQSVDYDNIGGIRAAVEHLAALGHRRIAYLGAAEGHSTAEQRLRGFELAMKDSGLDLDPAIIPASTFEVEPCQAALENLVSTGADFTAVIAARDEIAVRALRVFRNHGLSVPDDVSLVGFDDMPFMGDLTPALTTVRVPYRELGRRAGMLIADSGPDSPQVLPVELVVRASTSALHE